MEKMQMKDLDEHELVRLLQKGDERAFAEIYLRYREKIIVRTYGLLRSSELVQDVVQEAFSRLWAARKQLDAEKKVEAYIITIVRNHIIDLFRKMKHDQKLKDSFSQAVGESYDHIEPLLYKKENSKMLFEALDNLPSLQREVFVMFKLEQKSYKEIMDRFSISKSAVNSHIYRSNQFVKDYLLKHYRDDLVLLLLALIFFD